MIGPGNELTRNRHESLQLDIHDTILLLLEEETVETKSDVLVRGSGTDENVDIEDVKRELKHVHLPELEDAGYIEWDRETGEISKGPHFGDIEPLVELLEIHCDELSYD